MEETKKKNKEKDEALNELEKQKKAGRLGF